MQLLTRNSHRGQVNLGRLSGDPRMERPWTTIHGVMDLDARKKWEVELDRD
jgi:hypothetical protein